MGTKIFAVTFEELKQPGFILKFLEIVILLATTLVARLGRGGQPTSFHKTSTDADTLGHGICVAYLIISPILVIGYLIGEVNNQRRKMEFLFTTLGALLFIFSGAVAVDFWRTVALVPMTAEPRLLEKLRAENYIALVQSERGTGLALGCLSLFSGFLYLIDAFFSYKFGLTGQ